MNREFLKGLGLEDEAIDKIMTEHGKTVNKTKDELEATTKERDALQTQVKEHAEQLKVLSTKAENSKELQEEIEKLREVNETQKFEFSLEKALTKAKARNPIAVKALLKKDELKLDGETILGLDAQLKKIVEEEPYLFAVDEDAAKGGLKGRTPNDPPGGAAAPLTKNPFAKETFNLTEQGRLLKDDPELYKQLKAQA